MRSIRADLTARLFLGLGLTVVAASAGSYALVRRAVAADFDRSLAAKARALSGLVAFDENGFELELAEHAAPEYQRPESAAPAPDPPETEYLDVWIDGGALVARSPSLRGADLERRAGALGEPVFWDERAGGREVRAVGLLFQPKWDDDSEHAGEGEPPRVLVVTARARSPLDATLAGLAAIFAAGCAATLLVIAGFVRSAVRRSLRPVERLGRRMDAIDAATLSRRLSAEGLPLELGFVPPVLNALLERLEQAFERERRMTGNLAHELRTPLAELRTASEVARRWPDDAELRVRALATAHDVSVRLGALVDALLKLSRVASGEARLELDRILVRPALSELWRSVAEAAREREQRLELDVAGDVAVTTDRDLLGVAVGNLLGNAVQHGARGRPIRCAAAAHDGGVRVTVANGANGLRQEDLGHLAEPFWRADAARGGDRGVGLGLALVGDVAVALGARLSFELAGGEFRAHLDLPDGHARAPAPTPGNGGPG